MRKLLYSLLISVVLTACQSSQPVKPYKALSDTNANHLTSEEQNLWYEAQKIDEILARNGSLYDDLEVNNYVQSVIDKLYPEFKGRIRIKLLKDPTMNAFALLNGSIYFTIGLIARMENEAQLVTVLGHEAAHFIRKHRVKSRRRMKSATAFGLIFGMAGGGIFAQLATYTSIYGYSRELEREADQYAFHRMHKAGFDVSQAVLVFKKLQDEAKAYEIKRRILFASHPKLQERIDTFTELTKKYGGVSGELGKERFLQKTMKLRVAVLDVDLRFRRYQSVILALENVNNRKLYPSFTAYHLGEAYRQRGGADDMNKAMKLYQKAISVSPKFASPYYAIGVHYLKTKNYQEAKAAFDTFLKLAPQDKLAAYARHYLEKIHSSN